MKHLISKSTLFLLLVFAQFSYAQAYKDCETAFRPCGQSPFYFTNLVGGGMSDSQVENSCVEVEVNSTWITWTIAQGSIFSTVVGRFLANFVFKSLRRSLVICFQGARNRKRYHLKTVMYFKIKYW